MHPWTIHVFLLYLISSLPFRKALAKELGFNVTGGIFTSDSAQKSAEKADMECLFKITYKQFGEKCDIEFDSDTEDLKIFGAKVE